jgi:hypothetical protein
LFQELHFAVLVSNALEQLLPLLLRLVCEVVDFRTRVSSFFGPSGKRYKKRGIRLFLYINPRERA